MTCNEDNCLKVGTIPVLQQGTADFCVKLYAWIYKIVTCHCITQDKMLNRKVVQKKKKCACTRLILLLVSHSYPPPCEQGPRILVNYEQIKKVRAYS